MPTIVHVTHEALIKIGGIGAVLDGLLTSRTYQHTFARNILVGPLWEVGKPVAELMGPGGEVLYSGPEGIRKHALSARFAEIEREFGCGLVYGRRTVTDPVSGITATPEILLLAVNTYNPVKINEFKAMLFSRFGIESMRYEHIWDYEQYCRIAWPTLAAVEALTANPADPIVIMAHEYMGMPTALAAIAANPERYRTIFYAHEVAPIRRIVEEQPGHDTMFYNALRSAEAQKLYVDAVFGDPSDYYKHPLVKAARLCDNIFAVGDYVKRELQFLNDAFDDVSIDIAYNGVPFVPITLAEKMASKARLQRYCHNLLGYTPDYILTHVTRMVPSKGLWRDNLVMAELDKHLQKSGQTAVLLVLSTEPGKRSEKDVQHMEKWHHWPVAHREGYPDLTGGEAGFYAGVQYANVLSRNAKVIYINQFGFNRAACGSRMPAEVEFADIRHGSDVEFGQSIYEPFGIAQVEPIGFGGICVYTEICGCAGFVRLAAGNQPVRNALEVDYTQLPAGTPRDLASLLKMTREQREAIEATCAVEIAAELFARLPKNEADYASLLKQAHHLGSHMSWDAVAQLFVVPGIQKTLQR
jgi:hypothetical protein